MLSRRAAAMPLVSVCRRCAATPCRRSCCSAEIAVERAFFRAAVLHGLPSFPLLVCYSAMSACAALLTGYAATEEAYASLTQHHSKTYVDACFAPDMPFTVIARYSRKPRSSL